MSTRLHFKDGGRFTCPCAVVTVMWAGKAPVEQWRSPVEDTILERDGPIRRLQRKARPPSTDLSLGLGCSAVFTVRLLLMDALLRKLQSSETMLPASEQSKMAAASPDVPGALTASQCASRFSCSSCLKRRFKNNFVY